jgi:PHD/YefM family antitoxin component YafN of YafNO toxin-antitoxin module
MEEETIEGTVVDVRGPFQDGTYELDIEQENGETVTVTISAEQYAEMAQELEEQPIPSHLLN